MPPPYTRLANSIVAHPCEHTDVFEMELIDIRSTVVPEGLAVGEVGERIDQAPLTAVSFATDVPC